jgi:hypothetical protein
MKKKGFTPEEIIAMLREARYSSPKERRQWTLSASSVSPSRHTTDGERVRGVSRNNDTG